MFLLRGAIPLDNLQLLAATGHEELSCRILSFEKVYPLWCAVIEELASKFLPNSFVFPFEVRRVRFICELGIGDR